MITFKKIKDPDNKFDICNITFEIQDNSSLDDLISEFECFLKACGYDFAGKIIIDDEEYTNED
jgi:hypothetical protein